MQYHSRGRGYIVVRDRVSGHVLSEADTVTCAHCGGVYEMRPQPTTVKRSESVGGHCRVCWGLTCPRCTADGRCTPFERRLEQMEARGRLLAQVQAG